MQSQLSGVGPDILAVSRILAVVFVSEEMVMVHSLSLLLFEAGDSSAWCVKYIDCTVERTVNEAPEHSSLGVVYIRHPTSLYTYRQRIHERIVIEIVYSPMKHRCGSKSLFNI